MGMGPVKRDTHGCDREMSHPNPNRKHLEYPMGLKGVAKQPILADGGGN